MVIDSRKYHFPCDDLTQFSDSLEDNVRAIFNGLIEKRTSFLDANSSGGEGLTPYFDTHWEDFPFEAGMSYMCKGDYDTAIRCFELAEEENRIVTKSIGIPGRYLHLVFIDYCKAMQSGIEWTDSLAVNGFASDTI